MALTASSLKWFWSGGPSSSPGNNNADGALSTGGGISTVEVPSGGLFKNVAPGEIGVLSVYRCIFLKNTSTGTVNADTAYNLKVWITGVPANCTMMLTCQANASDASVATTFSRSNQYDAPNLNGYQAFADYSTYGLGFTPGTSATATWLEPNWAVPIWIRRVTPSGYNATPAGFNLHVGFAIVA